MGGKTSLQGAAAASAALLAFAAGTAFGQESPAPSFGPGSAGASSAPAPAPPMGTLLPEMGVDPTTPDLGTRLLQAFGQSEPSPPGTPPAPSLSIVPRVTVGEEFTDDAALTAGAGSGLSRKRGDDAVTLIQPELTVTDSTERLNLNLDYAPTAEIFAAHSDYSQFRQQASGDALATVMPGLVYFDLRGSVSEQPVFGGTGFTNTTTLSPNDREMVSSFSASPYLNKEFGTFATLQAGVGYGYTGTDAPSYLSTSNPNQYVPPSAPYNYGSSWLATRRIFASVTTGEDWGRFRDNLGTDDNFYDGSGELRNGQRVLVTNDASYAVNRFLSVLGEIGYENLSYPEAAYAYVGGIWSGGLRVTPNAESTLTLEYRRIDGINAPYVYGSYQITPKLRVFGGYSEGITTFNQDQQNSLLSGTADSNGVFGSTLVAAPLLYTGSSAGSNQSLNHARRLDASASLIGERNTITATFSWDRSSIVGNLLGLPTSVLNRLGIGNALLSQAGLLTTDTTNNLTGALGFQRQLQPDLRLDTSIGYTRSREANIATGTESSMQINIGLSKTLTETLTGRVTYSGNYNIDNGGPHSYAGVNSDTVLVSITKIFK